MGMVVNHIILEGDGLGMAIYMDPMKKINVPLDIEEIILIKESLDDAAKKQKAFSVDPKTNAALSRSAQKKSDAMQSLMDRLSIYGYGYKG